MFAGMMLGNDGLLHRQFPGMAQSLVQFSHHSGEMAFMHPVWRLGLLIATDVLFCPSLLLHPGAPFGHI